MPADGFRFPRNPPVRTLQSRWCDSLVPLLHSAFFSSLRFLRLVPVEGGMDAQNVRCRPTPP